jgi:site-specific DNA-methyltransferase (adenine-specific)
MKNEIICGDCIDVLSTIPEQSVDLVVTSPPYAEQRKNYYTSINEENYPLWTTRWMESCIKSLKPAGSIAIVIRPHISKGQISDYILKTRLAIRECGWKECEELIWIKTNSPPLGSLKRPRRSWESILWFSRTTDPFCEPKANGTPSDRIGLESKKGIGEYKSGASAAKTGIARCRDYVEVGTSGVDRAEGNKHPAQYPPKLAEWIIRLLTPENGLVLDPFVGSGTTAIACVNTERNYIGIDVSKEYCEYAEKRLQLWKNKKLE